MGGELSCHQVSYHLLMSLREGRGRVKGGKERGRIEGKRKEGVTGKINAEKGKREDGRENRQARKEEGY